MTVIRGHFDGRVIVPDEPVDLPRGSALIIHIEPARPVEDVSTSFGEWAAQHPIDDPSLPADLGRQHDHYLYGTPKRQD